MEHQNNRPQPALYPLKLEVHYRIVSGKLPVAGSGQTTLFGSRTLVFITDQEVRSGARLEIAVFWPVLLDDRVRLQLVIQGRAVQVDGNKITVSIGKHYFRTRGTAAPNLQPTPWVPRMVPMPAAHAGQQIALRAHA